VDDVCNAYLHLAGVLENANKQEEAAQILELATRQFPDRGILSFALGRLYLTKATSCDTDLLGSYSQKAIYFLERALKNEAIDKSIRASANEHFGLALRLEERYEDAIHAFREAVQLGQNGVTLWVALGDCLSLLGSPKMLPEALTALDTALKLDPRSVDALRFKGRVLREMGQPREALACFDEVLRIDSDNAFVLTGRAECFRMLGDLERALSDLDKAVIARPSNPLARVRRSGIKITQEDYKGALEDLCAALEVDPDLPGALANRGLVYQRLGHYEKSLSDLNAAINSRAEPLALVYTYRGQTFYLIDEFQKALDDFNHAVLLDTECIPAYAGRASCYYVLENYNEALSDLSNKVLPAQIQGLRPWHQRADIWYRLGNHQQCLEDLKKADAISANHPITQIIRSRLFLALDHVEDALQCIDLALATPRLPITYIIRGELLACVQRFTESLAEFDAFLNQEHEKHDWALFDKALVLKKMGHDDDAASCLTQAISLLRAQNERHIDYRETFNRALYHLAANELAESKHLYQDALRSNPPAWALIEAKRDLSYFMRLFPNNETAQLLLKHLETSTSA